MEKLNISYPNRMRLETSGREFAAKSSPNYVQNGFNRLRTHSNLFFKCKSKIILMPQLYWERHYQEMTFLGIRHNWERA